LTKIKANLGLSADDAPLADDKQDGNTVKMRKVNWLVDINSNSYPNEFRLLSSSIHQFQDSTMTENVMKLVINYDHYFTSGLEGFVFLERFSDSYMSIQQRYEIGTGLKVEGNLFPSRRAEIESRELDALSRSLWKNLRDIRRRLNDAGNLARLVAPILEALPDEGGSHSRVIGDFRGRLDNAVRDGNWDVLNALVRKTSEALARSKTEAAEYDDFVASLDSFIENSNAVEKMIALLEGKIAGSSRLQRALKKERSLFSLGLSASVFSELEKAEMIRKTPEGRILSFAIPAASYFRAAIRPSIDFRPLESVKLRGNFYLKFLLGQAEEAFQIVTQPDPIEKRNIRIDSYWSLEFTLPTPSAWAKKVGLSLNYEYHHDGASPCLSRDDQIKLQAQNMSSFFARDTHHIYSLSFQIEF
jgi:hypothetical protein